MKISPARKSIIGFVVAVILSLGSIIYSYTTSKELYENFGWVEHTYRVDQSLESVFSCLTENESAVRGYVITSNKDFTKKIEESAKTINVDLLRLDSLTKDNHLQYERVKAYKDLAKKRIDMLYHIISLKDSGAYIEKIIPMISEGKLLMDRIRILNDIMEKEEELLLHKRQKKAYLNLENANLMLLLSALTACIIVAFAIVIIKKDIEQRSRLERQLRELNANKNKFFSIISHDLRNPVHGIVKLAGFLKDEKIPKEDTLLAAQMIETSAKRTADLMENLLKWSKLQMNGVQFLPVSFRIYEIAQHSLNGVQSLAEAKNLNLHNKIESSIKVKGDKNMIEAVIRNLVSNAIKFSFEGKEIILSSEVEGNAVKISVKDQGIGIDENTISKLFYIENVQSTKGTANETGSGLGLILCKEFVEKNGGKIYVKSVVDKGSEFIFTIPLSDDAI